MDLLVMFKKRITIKCRNRSFLFLLGSFLLLCTLLDFDSSNGCFFSCNLDGSVKGLLAVDFGRPDGSILDALFKEGAGDGANNFVFFDKDGGGDVLSEFGDTSDESVVSGLIEEDGVVSFLFDFSLGPFLYERGVTLAPPFF
jgi:hypothetical protein